MPHEIRLEEIAPTPVIGVRYRAATDAIGEQTGAAYAQLYQALTAAGIAPAGPPRLVYESMGEQSWDLFACSPVAEEARAPEGLVREVMPGGRAATTLHIGPYEQLGEAYGAIQEWMSDNDLKGGEPVYDVYLTDPSVTQQSQHQTQVVWFLS